MAEPRSISDRVGGESGAEDIRAAGRSAERRLQRALRQAVERFGLIQPGDRLLVAVSGGKDSFTLLELLCRLQKRRGGFELVAVHVDPGFGGDGAERLSAYCHERRVPFHVERTVIRRLLAEKLDGRKSPCSLCSRLRRGVLYGLMDRLGCSRLALGHHADDLLETLWLNLLFTGQLKSMPPLLRTDDGRHLVIRPLALAFEEDIRLYARWKNFPLVAIPCPALAERERLRRRGVKAWLVAREAEHPGVKRRMLKALSRLQPQELLDPRLWPATFQPARLPRVPGSPCPS